MRIIPCLRHAIFLALPAFLITSCKKKDSKEEQQKRIPEIEVARPVEEPVTDYLVISGTIQSDSKVDVVCRVNGKILTRHFTPGQKVHKGQLLFSIESKEYRDQLSQQQENLKSAKSQYEYAKKHLEALQEAYAKDAVAKFTLLEAESSLEQAKASVRTAEAELNEAQLQLSYCSITAPTDGTISETTKDVGSYISGDGNPVVLCTIVNNDELKVVFQVEDSEYKELPEAEESLYNNVPLNFSESVNGSYTAKLYYKSPSIDSSTGLMTIQGRVNNPSGTLRDGMYCTISLPLGYESDALLVKGASIGTDQLGKYIYTVSDNNRIVKQHITTGQTWQDSLTVVKQGVKPTDRYVVNAMMSIREGEEVKPILIGK